MAFQLGIHISSIYENSGSGVGLLVAERAFFAILKLQYK